MANSKIIITFLEVPAVNYEVNIIEENLLLFLNEKFKPHRFAPKQVDLPEAYITSDPGDPPVYGYSDYTSNRYKTAFNLDYNSTGLFTVTTTPGTAGDGLGTVTIEANYPGAVFIYEDDLAGVVSVETINQAPPEEIAIESVVFSQDASLPCKQLKVVVTTSVLATEILSPEVVHGNTDNPFELVVLRGTSGNIIVENSSGSQVNQPFQAPAHLIAANFSVNVSNSPSGATVTVSNILSDGLELEYSLDNDTWQSSNVFSGLLAGDYTLYVRDQLGCSFTIDFNVNDVAIYVPYFAYSKSNSLRMAERITWGDAANYKTDENTLSCEVDVANPHHEIQFFQSADIVTCQFKSNYSTNAVKVIKADLSEIDVPVIKKTDWIGVKDKRDARKYDLGGGKVGIYFLAGNTYDYVTDVVNGSHALNGLVPEWGVPGNYISIGGSWFLIEQVVFDDAKNADVLVITETYTGAEIDVVAGCIYNIYPFEVYEFTIDMVDFLNQRINVKFLISDPHFPTLTFLSEDIDVKVKQEFTKDVYYWNDDNEEVFCATGIRHRIRMPYTRIEGGDEDESSNHKTDTNTILLSADIYEGEKFIFEPTTKEMWRKLKRALSHKNVYIDGVKYAKNGEYESEGPLLESNLYVLKATMLKSGNVYNSDGSTFGAGNASNSQIPGIIQGDDSFIKY